MKVIITATEKRQLALERERLQESLEEYLTHHKAVSDLDQRCERLRAEIAELEQADPDEADKIRRLQDRRTELTLAEHRLKELPSAAGTEHFHGFGIALRTLGYSLEKALKATETAYLREISKLVRPLCISDDRAVQVAVSTDAAGALAKVIHRRFGSFGAGPATAREALAQCDQVLAGDLSFVFDPKLKS